MEKIDDFFYDLVGHSLFFGVSPTLILLATVLLIVLLNKFVQNKSTEKRRKGKDILLLGCCDGGKTSLFLKLADSTWNATTFSSQIPNENILKLSDKKNVRIIDYPGHNRIRDGARKFFRDTAGIVFLLDANSDRNEFTKAADFLYFLLTDKTITDQEIPILVACNKSDLVTHRKSEEIQKILENELNLIRDSQASQPGRHEAEEQPIFLGIEGEKFTIDQLEIPVQFTNITVLGSGSSNSVERVLEFLNEVTD